MLPYALLILEAILVIAADLEPHELLGYDHVSYSSLLLARDGKVQFDPVVKGILKNSEELDYWFSPLIMVNLGLDHWFGPKWSGSGLQEVQTTNQT